jgi:hypothetical protein
MTTSSAASMTFEFAGTPSDTTLVNDLAGSDFIAQQR